MRRGAVPVGHELTRASPCLFWRIPQFDRIRLQGGQGPHVATSVDRLRPAAAGRLPTAACGGGSVYLEGAFKTGEIGWGDADAHFQVSGSEATFAPEPGTQTARWDASLSVGDADACVTLTMPANVADPSRTYAGLLFWVMGKDDFYEFVVAPNAFFSITRRFAVRSSRSRRSHGPRRRP